ncbi:adenylosuccinate synthetase [Cellulophaga sp. L1A9]|uniref:adenylosuccinate synthetase n=1 Tax=Cellulophaga sp. L1A9 TaxID=2686362 RepID=UPI00131DF82E|nr:adenylosuccinate synthetase [Cellulophaga sp. L1A9]
MKKAKIVIGLGFGDEGKGITTDFLCSQNPEAIVIRFSGGQQAAHTVLLEGKKHVHSSFASGALRGLPSYFSEHCTVHPTLLFNEFQELNFLGGNTTLYIHPLAKITTPFDVFQNRNNTKNLTHGTCGKGVGATMKRNEGPFKLYAIDLIGPRNLLLEKLKQIGNYYGFQYDENFKNDVAYYLDCIDHIDWKIEDYTFLNNYSTLIFEGSQGILLDMNHGTFPHVTYANTSSKNAIEICDALEIKDIEMYYVTRCYSTRHGNGYMPNEQKIVLKNNEEETCTYNEFQKELRTGLLDTDLLLHSLKIDQIYSKATRANLIITCLDQYQHKIDFKKLALNFTNMYGSYSPYAKDFQKINPQHLLDKEA